MIHLKNIQPFARGGRRECFVHPDHADRCIKVLRLDRLPHDLKRSASWWRSVRKGVDEFDENMSDWRALNAVQAAVGDDSWNAHVPRLFGWEETDRGRGLVIELLRDADGLISRTLHECLWERGYDEVLRAAVERLAFFWEARTIPSRSLGLHNIVAQFDADGGARLVVVDGLGGMEFLRLSRLLRTYALRRSRSKIAGLRCDITELLERKASNRSAGSRGFLLSRS